MKQKLLTLVAFGTFSLGSALLAQGTQGSGDVGSALQSEDAIALREQLQAERAAIQSQIADLRQTSNQLKEQMKGLGMERGEMIEIPEELQAARDALRELSKTLADSRRAAVETALAALADDATVEEKAAARTAALEAWSADEANAAALAERDALRETVSSQMSEYRPDGGMREGATETVRNRIREFRNSAEFAAMKEERAALREQLDASETEEEKEALIAAFREKYKDLIQERRELKREERSGR